MTVRGALLAIAALALVGCGGEAAPAKPVRPDAAPVAPVAAPAALTLARVAPGLTLRPTAAAAVIVSRDGALAVAPMPAGDGDGVRLDGLVPEPVSEPGALRDRLATMIAATTSSPCEVDAGVDNAEFFREPLEPLDVMDARDGVLPAGLRATSAMSTLVCAKGSTLVLVDVAAPAARAVEVLSAVPSAVLGVTVDGDRARALAALFTYQAGSAAGAQLDVGFTVQAAGVRGAIYQGPVADAARWSWTGDVAGIAGAYRAGERALAMFGGPTARLRVDADVTSERLVATIAALLEGEVQRFAIGEPLVIPQEVR